MRSTRRFLAKSFIVAVVPALWVAGGCDSSSTVPEIPIDVADTQPPAAVLDVPDRVSFGAPIVLDGSGSTDVGGQVALHTWTKLSGEGGSLAPGSSVITESPMLSVESPASNPLVVGQHAFRLVVTDDSGNQSPPAEATVVVIDDLAPTAVLEAPVRSSYAASFELDGRGSFDAGGGQIVRYVWTRLSGSGGSFPGGSIETEDPFLVVDSPPENRLTMELHTFELVVVDASANASEPVEASVVVIDDVAPTAVLDAPDRVASGSAIVLDASQSVDPDGGTIVQYRFTKLSGSGGSMPLNVEVVTTNPTWTVESPAGNPLAFGEHTFQLEVVDASGNVSQPDPVSVTVFEDGPPTAAVDAPIRVGYQEAIELDGQASSSPGGSVVAWIWTRLQGEGGDPDLPVGVPVETDAPEFVVESPAANRLILGSHRFRLEVRDDSGRLSEPAEVVVVVIDDQAPTAVLTAPERVRPSSAIVLDGNRSFDPDGGTIVQYRFTKLSGSGGSMPLNIEVGTTNPTWTVESPAENPLALGEHTFQLEVVDLSGNVSQPAHVSVLVEP